MSTDAPADLDLQAPPGTRIAILAARFNGSIVTQLLDRCTARLDELSVPHEVFRVPGAFELPTAARVAADARFDAVICLGCVIRGETYHFETVANEAAAGIREVGVRSGKPILFGVLTVENEAQALARMDTGRAAADGAVEMLMTLAALRASTPTHPDAFALR